MYGPPQGPPGWGPPGPPGPPRKPNNGGTVIAVIGVILVLLLGGGVGLWYLSDDDNDAVAPPVAEPGITHFSPPDLPTPPVFSPPALPSFTPYTPPDLPTTPPSYSPAFNPQPGDCVRNTGSYSHPRLYMARCTPGHYRVLDRIDDTTNTRRCASTGYTYAVWYPSPAYVLCLRGL